MEKQNNSHLKTSTLFEESKSEIPVKHGRHREEKSTKNVKSSERQGCERDMERGDLEDEDSNFEFLYQGCKKQCRIFLEKITDAERKQPVKRSLQEVLSLIKLERLNKNDYMQSVNPVINSQSENIKCKSFRLNITNILNYAKRIHNIKMSWFQSYEKLINFLAETSSFEMCSQLNHLIMDICQALSEQDLLTILKKLDHLMTSQQNTTQNNFSKHYKHSKHHKNFNRSNAKLTPPLSKNNNSKPSWNAKSKNFVGPASKDNDITYEKSPNSAGIRMKRKPLEQYSTSVSSTSMGSSTGASSASISDFTSSASSASDGSDTSATSISTSFYSRPSKSSAALSTGSTGPQVRTNKARNNNKVDNSNKKNDKKAIVTKDKETELCQHGNKCQQDKSPKDANNSNILPEHKRCFYSNMESKMMPRYPTFMYQGVHNSTVLHRVPKNPGKCAYEVGNEETVILDPNAEKVLRNQRNLASGENTEVAKAEKCKIVEEGKMERKDRGDHEAAEDSESMTSDHSYTSTSATSTTTSDSSPLSDSDKSLLSASSKTYVSEKKERKRSKRSQREKKGERGKKGERREKRRHKKRQSSSSSKVTADTQATSANHSTSSLPSPSGKSAISSVVLKKKETKKATNNNNTEVAKEGKGSDEKVKRKKNIKYKDDFEKFLKTGRIGKEF